MSQPQTEDVTIEDLSEDEELASSCPPPPHHHLNNNNSVEENNNNTIFQKFADRPLNIQVTAKVLFGSVTAISALNAERKKKPGTPPSPQ